MPRKTDGIPFEVHRSPSTDDNGNVVLYATPQSNRIKEFKEIEGWLNAANIMRVGALQQSFDVFLDECVRWMSQGYRVQTPLGAFSMKLGMKRKITNPRQVRHDDVEFKGIDFRPSTEFTKLLKRKVECEGFRYVHRADSTTLMANDGYMEEALRKSIKADGGYTTIPSFMMHSGLSKYSATRKLDYWCAGDSPLLKRRKLGHSVIYELLAMQ